MNKKLFDVVLKLLKDFDEMEKEGLVFHKLQKFYPVTFFIFWFRQAAIQGLPRSRGTVLIFAPGKEEISALEKYIHQFSPQHSR